MPIDITMPALSPTMEEGKLAKWHVKEGDSVSSGDVIAEIETDKATMEVEAVDEGKIGKILVAEGTEGVKVNAVIAVLLQEGDSADAVAAPKAAPAPAAKAEAPKAEPAKADAGATMRENTAAQAANSNTGSSAPAAAAAPAPAKADGGKVFASPLARRLAKEAGIEVSAISGSGPRGRVVKSDVEAAKSGKTPLKAGVSAPAAAPATGGVAATGMTKAQVLALYPEGSYELVPNDGMRKVVAARLTEFK
jgi:pyruvate dehydrogenase E2 component (dihydrolipoamide acetyltransferase)